MATISVLFRLVFIFAIPNLSQDFYRFIWDGRMLFEGLNPYLSTPEKFIEQKNYPISQALEIYQGMGTMNGSHFTNYPPVNQFCFYLAALFANKSLIGTVVILRLQIILADLGIMFYGKKMLEKLKLPVNNIFLYLLNPFVIIELTGNLHFEPVMLFFLVLAIYQIHEKRYAWAGISMACSIAVKLIPILFLPLFLTYIVDKKTNIFKNLKNLIVFYLVCFITLALFFASFLSKDFFANYSNSIGLWFRKFEFNASLYYLLREVGYWFRGYNEIAIIGKILPVLSLLFVVFITLFKKSKNTAQLILAMLWVVSFYYLASTTVHPWYLATLLMLSVFTKYRYALIWTLVVVLSYQAYASSPWTENLYIVLLEYCLVFVFIIYESNLGFLRTKKKG
ncbi:MAG: mannosyltransferase [Tenacibaculum sp.]